MFGSDTIRVKIKGFLRNITENDILYFDEKGIENKNKISFIKDDVKYSIKLSDSEITILREGNDYINSFIFNRTKGSSSYTLKDNNYTIDMDIIVKELIINDNSFCVKYLISDTNCEYEFKLEMSECL